MLEDAQQDFAHSSDPERVVGLLQQLLCDIRTQSHGQPLDDVLERICRSTFQLLVVLVETHKDSAFLQCLDVSALFMHLLRSVSTFVALDRSNGTGVALGSRSDGPRIHPRSTAIYLFLASVIPSTSNSPGKVTSMDP